MPKSGLIGFVGPTGAGGSPFVTWLLARTAQRDLSELVVASAYLTDRAADELVVALNAREASWKRANVAILVGTKDGFTRKSAIKALLDCKKNGVNVALAVRCPTDPQFHAKAAYARIGASTHCAVVGSHNLTGSGLTSASEFGVELAGEPAARVREALEHWIESSKSWSNVKYKERKQLPPSLRDSAPPPKDRDESAEQDAAHPAADTARASLYLTDAQQERWKRTNARFRKEHKSLARKIRKYFLEEQSVEDCIAKSGYERGARFIFTEHYPDNKPSGEWWDGQRMVILEVVHHLRSRKNETILACLNVEKFKSNKAVRALARSSGATRKRPTPSALAQFLAGVRRLKAKGEA